MKNLIYLLILLLPAIGMAQSYTLDQCIDSALKNNYSLKNSRLDYEASEQARKEAFTKYFPSVSATGMSFKATEYMIDENIDLSMLGQVFASLGIDPSTLGLPSSYPFQKMKDGTIGLVSATQPIFAGGQIVNGNKLARIGREVSGLKITLTENEVIYQTEEYFWQIVSLKEKIKTLDAVDTLLAEFHKSVSAAVNAGVTTRNELLRVELQQQNTESSRIKVENGIKALKLLLCNQTGAKAGSFDISLSGFPAVKGPAEYFADTETGIGHRAETQLLDKGVEAAKLQRKMAIGKNLPTVAAGAGYMYHNLLDKDVDFGIAFATVSIPISSWWGGSYAVRREKLNQEKAENQRQDMIEKMAVEIESKWDGLLASHQQINVARKSIDSATENLRISNDYYKAGTIALSDVLDAQTMLQQSRDQYVDACTTYYLRLSAYLLATGRKSAIAGQN